MGSQYAAGLAEAVHEEGVELESALRVHLRTNHFPPIHEDFVQPAKDAIEAAQCGDWNDLIDLPNGKTLTVSQIVRDLHLDAFVGNDADDEEDFEDVEFELEEDEELDL